MLFVLTFADTVVCGAQQQGVIRRTVNWLAMPSLCCLQVESCKQMCQDLQQALTSANTAIAGHVQNKMQQSDLVQGLQEQVKDLYISRHSMQSMSAQMLL